MSCNQQRYVVAFGNACLAARHKFENSTETMLRLGMWNAPLDQVVAWPVAQSADPHDPMLGSIGRGEPWPNFAQDTPPRTPVACGGSDGMVAMGWARGATRAPRGMPLGEPDANTWKDAWYGCQPSGIQMPDGGRHEQLAARQPCPRETQETLRGFGNTSHKTRGSGRPWTHFSSATCLCSSTNLPILQHRISEAPRQPQRRRKSQPSQDSEFIA